MRLKLLKGIRRHLWMHPNAILYLNSVKLNNLRPGVIYINVLQAAFACTDPECAKKDGQLDCPFCAFGICASESYLWNVDEMDPRYIFLICNKCSYVPFYS